MKIWERKVLSRIFAGLNRLGKRKHDNKTPMPIIIKFCRYTVRGRVFRNKNKLKGENVSITENLTKERVSELK